jgi:DNA-binding SARP family transcriptional activator
MFNLKTLGASELRDTDRPGASTLLGPGKPVALLTYLSAAPSRTASRSTLISLLWADLEPDAAKHALRQTLWYLKRKTGRDLVTTHGDGLQLAPEVEADRDALLRASAASAHEDVVRLYAGPFVPAFAVPGGGLFEEWCALERRRLQEVFRHSAEAIVRTRLSQGRARDALELARKLRDQDVYSEGGWRLLIEVCLSAGDLLAARAEAEALQELATNDGQELEPSTLAALRAARAGLKTTNGEGTPTDDSTSGIPSTLVGREAEFALLLAAWEAARSGKLTHVHLTARTGIGKTRLLRELAARIRAMRGKVVSISGSLGTRGIAYSVAGDLAAGLAMLSGKKSIAPESAATLVALNPSLSTWFEIPGRTAAPGDLLRARSLAIAELTAAAVFEHPVALLIDDLHWIDESSHAVLDALVAQVKDAKLLIVSAGRPEARRAAMVSHERVQHIELQPLSAAQVEELLLSIASLPAEPWAAQLAPELWRASRGSPLLVLEMLQLLEDRALLVRRDGEWRTEHPEALTGELRAGDVLRSRIQLMERPDRWVLTLLAVSGVPLDEPMIASAAGRASSEVRDQLRTLEARGFLWREGDAWRIAHDEISEELIALTNAEAMARASAHAGRALAAGDHDEGRLRRAAQLLSAGDDARARRDLFRRFVRRRYAQGDRRSVTEHARDLFGEDTPSSVLDDLRTAVPATWRLGLVSPARRAAAAMALIALGASAIAFAVRAPGLAEPDAVLGFAHVGPDGHVRFSRVDLRESDWNPLRPLGTAPWGAPSEIRLATGAAFAPIAHPSGNLLIASEAVADSGVIDLVAYERGRAPRRLAPGPGDDLGPSISPDGNMVAFYTARWDSMSHYDIALYSMRDGTLRRLTEGPASDLDPRWSPDGLRIAFFRNNWGAAPNEICVASVGDGALDCHQTPDRDVSVLGWMDDDRLVVHEQWTERQRVSVLALSTRSVAPVIDGPFTALSLSPDARWLYCRCAAIPSGELAATITSVAAPALTRRLAPDISQEYLPFWIASRAGLRVADVTVQPPANVQVGVPARFRATVTDASGTELRYHAAVRWSIEPPDAGTIDSASGILIPSVPHERLLVVAEVGSVGDSVALTVGINDPRVVFTEQWRDTTFAGWWRFGSPSPSVLQTIESQAAMRNNGDGSFSSGVLSRTAFRAADGLAVEVRVSTPITITQWQRVGVALVDASDTGAYRDARGRNAIPLSEHSMVGCAIAYPTEARPLDAPAIQANTAGMTKELRLTDGSLYSGSWRTLLVQLLPDGRCGVALDGKLLGTIDGGPREWAPLRVRIAGNTYRTDILVGEVRVYQGVVDWVNWSQPPGR